MLTPQALDQFNARAVRAFDALSAAAIEAGRAMAIVGPALLKFEWAMMTKAQRRRWALRMIREAKHTTAGYR